VLDKKKFVENMIENELSIDEIFNEVRREIHRTDWKSYHERDASENRAAGSREYGRFLRSLLFFLTRGTMSGGVSENDFWLLHRLAKYLVELRDFKPKILELFGQDEQLADLRAHLS
jgi:hypothetical protein